MQDAITYRLRTARERRTEIREAAAAIGIDDAFVDRLVERFYDRVLADDELAPIFASAAEGDWPAHLSRMKDFWASVAFNAGRYSGKPVPVHMKHGDKIRPDHFARWLALFEDTLREIAERPATVAYFMERAERIAKSLRLAMFATPELAGAARRPAR